MSSKADRLLTKATTFERLALYGDRKSFLQALAQQLPNLVVPNDPNAPPGQGGVHTVNPNPPPPVPKPKAPSMPRLVVPSEGGGGEWYDMDKSQPVDRDQFLPLNKSLPGHAAPEQARPQAPAQSGVNVNPTDLYAIQNYVNKQMLSKWPPVVPDGKWGPQTAALLQQWAKTNGVSGNMQNVIDAAKAKAGV